MTHPAIVQYVETHDLPSQHLYGITALLGKIVAAEQGSKTILYTKKPSNTNRPIANDDFEEVSPRKVGRFS